MTRIAGPTRAQLDQAADQYAALLDRQLARAVDLTMLTLGDRFDPDDLGVIPQHWAALVDDLLAPTLALALHAGSADIRRQLRRHLGLMAAGDEFHLPGKHNQKTHGHRRSRGAPTDGKAPAKPPGGSSSGGGAWSPTMSVEEAERYTAGTKIPGPIYQGTSKRAADAIEADGLSDAAIGGNTSAGAAGRGFYFTADPSYARMYSGGGTGRLLETRIKVTNPMGQDEMWDLIARENLSAGDVSAQRITEYAKGKGYDGIHIRNAGLFGQRGAGNVDEIVAFDPSQVVVVSNQQAYAAATLTAAVGPPADFDQLAGQELVAALKQAPQPMAAFLGLETGWVEPDEAENLTAAAWNGVPVTSQQLADAYLATARNRLVGVGDLTWQLAREQLLEGQRAGESIAQLRDRVASATGLASPRAGVIARTEILDALNYGAHAEMAATGLDGTKSWLATEDSRTRDDHEHADGQRVGVKEKFTVGGWPMDRPHDPAAPADQVVNCRCALTFEVDLDDVSLEPAQPPQEQAQEQADHQVLGAVWVADAIRRGVTADDLAALLSLAPFLPEEEPEAETAAAETEPLHLPGKHNQKDHGHRRNRGSGGRGSAPAKTPPSPGGAGGGGSAGGKSYDDPAAAKQFLDDHYGQWKKKDLSDAEYAGLSFYQSPGFALMNGQLRGLKKGDIKADMSFGDADLKRARKASGDLTKGIGKAPPLPHAVQVHRGFDAAQFGDLSPGMTVTDKGLVSTSLTSSGVASVGKAAKPGRMRMELPAGTKAGAGSARELILPPGSSFEILGVSQEGGTTVVDARLVGGGG